MAPKRQGTKVTFVKTAKQSNDTSVRKRKKQSSDELTSRKRQRRSSPEEKAMQQKKGKTACPLQAEIIQHVERCIDTAVLSVLSRKKVTAFETVQVQLSSLKKRLLQLCKDIRVPATKLGKLKNLARDVLQEQRKMEEYEDTLESLNHEIEEAVEMAEKIEESTVALEGKVEILNQQTPETSQSLDEISNKDPLQLPPATFDAPTLQDQAKKLDNPKLILKKLTLVQSNPVYKNMLNLLQTSYAEISTL
ncbi:uncharacterized protein LOC122940719 [Bufo gargarizans]|uniref:uncharacterized protein LOC122940719 n=1 Tax=Bufo gargarizans TaxID=30331 RepID=UPI001CF3BFB2|nr:uncharacterized protein LOC122940719 [Bufo gargarizans]XP_044153371.1 uncharacterized protein LOC122940719 [Bufo gargarizans]XP_044153372.1 uncharacterized protein LOC122940719 [Bufo gargarizans]